MSESVNIPQLQIDLRNSATDVDAALKLLTYNQLVWLADRCVELETALRECPMDWYGDIHENILDGGKRARAWMTKHAELLKQLKGEG